MYSSTALQSLEGLKQMRDLNMRLRNDSDQGKKRKLVLPNPSRYHTASHPQREILPLYSPLYSDSILSQPYLAAGP